MRKFILVSMAVLFQAAIVHAATPDRKPIAVVVEYTVKSGKEEELRSILREHARLTVEQEPGCLRFEVLQPVNKDGSAIPDRLMLTELYADEDAAAAHANNPRLATLLARIRPMLSKEKVTRTMVLASPTQ
ncbi:hypothetical protein ATN84_25400 [Paramesorhizobium deserti]|uniref:ABM domain-containing protein n=1 Tax=Paramesorhizobium deserti TaxID=1494590 RepID=A0A135HVI1_9HYPH|nr:antibiotic biosynthesis monooxygenase family protein [Paramesorhizobium deserti]KXF77158.1 hypothetical protein ATN84_25400 [Paramesorhizobium deserti]